MKHLNLHFLSVTLMLLLSATVYALNLEDYYKYTTTDAGGYKVGLVSEFQAALANNESYKDWNSGTPLPNPAPDGKYNGIAVTNMSGMFTWSKITSLDLSEYDTRNVTDMSYMFYSSRNLSEINLSSFDTRNVTDMSGMFDNCYELTTLDVSNFDTSKVTNMHLMFSDCYGLTTLDLSNFDTSNVTNMRVMFADCSGLTTLDLSNFDTSKVTTMVQMFLRCSSLTTLDVSNFNTSKVIDMMSMFLDCSSLTTLDVSSFDTSNVTQMNAMFASCTNLTKLDISNFSISAVSAMDNMFFECGNLTELDMRNFNVPVGAEMLVKEMFEDCGKSTDGKPAIGIVKSQANADAVNASSEVTKIDVERIKFVGQEETPSAEPFYTYHLLDNDTYQVRLSNGFKVAINDRKSYNDWTYGTPLPNPAPDGMYDGKQVSDMSSLFCTCSGITALDLSQFDTRNVTDLSWLFRDCASLETVDLSSFDTKNVTDMSCLFNGCSSLMALDVSNFDTKKVTGISFMFSDCSSLTTLDVSNFDTKNVINIAAMFSGCSSLTALDLSNFDTENVINMGSMFSDCSSLTRLDMRNSIVNISYFMFDNCGKAVDGVPAVGIVKTQENADALNASADMTIIDTSRLKFVDAAHSNVETLPVSDVKIFGTESTINIAACEGVDYTVYNTDGCAVATGTAVGNTKVTVPQGIYVVKAGKDTVKVVVK